MYCRTIYVELDILGAVVVETGVGVVGEVVDEEEGILVVQEAVEEVDLQGKTEEVIEGEEGVGGEVKFFWTNLLCDLKLGDITLFS